MLGTAKPWHPNLWKAGETGFQTKRAVKLVAFASRHHRLALYSWKYVAA